VRRRIAEISGLLAGATAGVVIATSGLPGVALAQSDADRGALEQKLKDAISRKERLDAQQRDADERARSLREATVTLNRERAELNARLMKIARDVQDVERDLTRLEAELADREVREQFIKGTLSAQHAKIAKLLAAMQRMGRNPPPVIVTKRKDALSMVRSAMLLAHAFPELKGEADRLRRQLTELEVVTKEIRANRDQLRSKKIELAQLDGELNDQIAAKKRSITVQQSELAAVLREAEQIKREAADLDQLVARLDRAIGQNTGLDAYNRELARQDRERVTAPGRQPEPETKTALAPRVIPPAAPRPPVTTTPSAPELGVNRADRPAPTPPPITRPGVTLAPDSGPKSDTGRLEPAIRFSQAKGKLPLPVAGRQAIRFGEITPLKRASKGVVFETRANARITSPSDGWVVYAGPFRSYGQVLIINGGDGYHVLMAGMTRIDVQLGQFILASEPVGAMGSTPESAGGSAKPVLYVEFRKDGKPVDPDPWWSKGQQVAQR
jgi:septal ring factor EnvC (AmiA/AmiB activator)